MSNAWTPGPWTLLEPDTRPFRLTICAGDEEVISQDRVCSATGQKTLADCLAAVGFEERPKDPSWSRATAVALLRKQQAIFRLIAAAPELYEALTGVLRAYSAASRVFHEGDGLVFEADPAVKRARAALAKARGDQ